MAVSTKWFTATQRSDAVDVEVCVSCGCLSVRVLCNDVEIDVSSKWLCPQNGLSLLRV